MKPGFFFILLCTTLFLVACSGIHSNTVRADQGTRDLNVLMISIDDLNDWVGVLSGHPQARTPNLDRLASESVLFTNA